MASTSSSFEKDEEPSDPQLQKIAPADPAVGRGPAGNSAEPSTTEIKKKKKKVLIQVPDSDVKRVLSYREETSDLKVPGLFVRRDPKLAANWAIMLANLAMYDEQTKGRMLEEQRDFRQQVTYELEVDEDDDRFKDVESTSSGQRRYRPGVMKPKDGQTRKLN
ncbi:hypothetical protein VPH35_012620 [Triticum aestivum]